MAESGPDPDAVLWCGKADEDLLVVELIDNARGPSGIACFHCQQAVEKYLKACLAAAGDLPPRTHDIEYLADLLEQRGIRLGIDRALLSGLRLYAVAPRYPGFGDEESERDVTVLRKFAREIRDLVRAHLGLK